MPRLLRLLAVCLALITLSPRAHAEFRVVTTVPDLAALAAAVGGKRVKVESLALHTQDPHWVDARPHLALHLAKADLLLVVGADLEVGWLPTLLTGSRNARVQPGAPGYLDCSTLVALLEVATGPVDRSAGDVHAAGNPHYLADPREAVKVVAGIAERLAQLDPEGAADYRGNAAKLTRVIEKWRRSWERKLAGLRGKQVVAYHRSLTYLASWLGLEVLATVEPRPGIPPNPRHVKELIERARAAGVVALLQESWHPQGTPRLIARRVGVPLVVLPGGTNFRGRQSYVGHVQDVVKRLEGVAR